MTESSEFIVDIVMSVVCEAMKISDPSLLFKSYCQRSCAARMLATYLIRDATTLSYPAIGRFFRKDHSTIMYGYKIIAERITNQPEFAKMVDDLKAKIASRLSRTFPAEPMGAKGRKEIT